MLGLPGSAGLAGIQTFGPSLAFEGGATWGGFYEYCLLPARAEYRVVGFNPRTDCLQGVLPGAQLGR